MCLCLCITIAGFGVLLEGSSSACGNVQFVATEVSRGDVATSQLLCCQGLVSVF